MCNMCDGRSFEQQRAALRQQLRRRGWTSLSVLPDGAGAGWAYTIGLCREGHPELVVYDEPPEVIERVFASLVPRLLAGSRLTPGFAVEVDGRRWTTRPLARAVVEAGLLGWWPEVFPHCPCHALPDAVELLDVEVARRIDGGDPPPATSSEGRTTTRAARRRQAREQAKRRHQDD